MPDLLRRTVSALVPDSAKTAFDNANNRRAMRRIEPANRTFVQRHGLTVSGGPFAGMRYLPGQEATQGDLVRKLLGIYEQELHDAVNSWPSQGITTVVNVGSAEGYYAVGLAHMLGQATVLAYDINPEVRVLCRQLAVLNGVEDRVDIRGECTPETLADLPERNVGLVCDCEGYELTLLDPVRAPILRNWTILVELHDQFDPRITQQITERFTPTHDVTLIDSVPADLQISGLDYLTATQRELVLTERVGMMRFAHLTPLA